MGPCSTALGLPHSCCQWLLGLKKRFYMRILALHGKGDGVKKGMLRMLWQRLHLAHLAQIFDL
jgi:hypothetical protein